MKKSKTVVELLKEINILNLIFGIVIIIFISMFTYKFYLNYKINKVSEAYAKESYEIYLGQIFPVFDNITMEDLMERRLEYDNLNDDTKRRSGHFKGYLYTYYKFDSAMGELSNVNASGLKYFANTVRGFSIPMAVDTTMSYFVLSQNKEELQKYFHSDDFKPVYKSVEELFIAPIYIYKEIMKMFNKEFFSGHSYSETIVKIAEYIYADKYTYDYEKYVD